MGSLLKGDDWLVTPAHPFGLYFVEFIDPILVCHQVLSPSLICSLAKLRPINQIIMIIIILIVMMNKINLKANADSISFYVYQPEFFIFYLGNKSRGGFLFSAQDLQSAA